MTIADEVMHEGDVERPLQVAIQATRKHKLFEGPITD